MGKMPAMQFYPGDYLNDVGVASLGYFGKGVWIELLCRMHYSAERGMLMLNGRAMTREEIAEMLKLPLAESNAWIDRLLSAGVASMDDDTGALISRRMVRDDGLRKYRASFGDQGGNPALSKVKPKFERQPASLARPEVPKGGTEIPGINGPVRLNGVPASTEKRKAPAVKPGPDRGFWTKVLEKDPASAEQLKHLPGLMKYENDYESVVSILRMCRLRTGQFPRIQVFVNTMLGKNIDAVAIAGALARVFDKLDRGEKIKEIWPFAEIVAKKPDVTDAELERLKGIRAAGMNSVGDTLKELNLGGSNGGN